MNFHRVKDKTNELSDLRLKGWVKGKSTGFTNLDEIFTLKVGFPLFIAGAPHCFCKGQLVHTSKGVKSIDKIKVGDKVLSYNHELKINEYRKVIDTPINLSNTEKILRIKMKDGTIINVTEKHRFYTGTEYLQIKDILLSLQKK